MSNTRPPCRSCGSMLADFSLYDTLKSEAGVDFLQTAQDFHSAIDHGCGVCLAIHQYASPGRRSDNKIWPTVPFCCRPESPSNGSENLIKNVRLQTTRPDSYDVKFLRVTIGSAENRCGLYCEFDIDAQEGMYISCQVCRYASGGFSNTFGKTIRQRSTSAPGR